MEGGVDDFCCPGCEMAAAIIRGAGLERYYVDREQAAPRPEPVGAGDWSAVTVTIASDGRREAAW